MNESILITGANIGLGKETARQLALKKETKKVILFCRNQAKAEAAKKDLEEKTGKKIFEIVIGDVADADSVRKAVEEIKEPIDAIILNAGGMVGKTAGKITPSGMNEIAATNILGHVILVEELIKHDKLKKAVLLASSEAIPGVKMLGMKPVSMKTSSADEFAAVLDGSFFGNKLDPMQAYGYVKYVITMWMFSMATFRCSSPAADSSRTVTVLLAPLPAHPVAPVPEVPSRSRASALSPPRYPPNIRRMTGSRHAAFRGLR